MQIGSICSAKWAKPQEVKTLALTETQDRILKVLKLKDEPLTVRMIANELNVTGQTVRNHLPKLISMGRVKVYPKGTIEGSTAYVVTEGSGANVNPISWFNGEYATVRQIFEKFGDPGAKLNSNTFWAAMEKIILNLYSHALDAIDDDNPQPVSQMTLRDYRRALENIYNQANFVREAARDLLGYDELWNPRELPKALIINDTKLDVEKARDILYRSQRD